jgi:hypothetical protein
MPEHTLKKLLKLLQVNEFAVVQDLVAAMLMHCVSEDVQNLPWSAISLKPATAACVLKAVKAVLLIVQPRHLHFVALVLTDFVELARLTTTAA